MNPQNIDNQVTAGLQKVIIDGIDIIPFVKPDIQDVVSKVNSLSHNMLALQTPSDFFDTRLLVETLDRAARDYTRNAQIVGAASGGATGTVGLAGLGANFAITQFSKTLATKVGDYVWRKTVINYLLGKISAKFTGYIAVYSLRAVPIISSVTGAVINATFLSMAGKKSMQYFRERHLFVRKQVATVGNKSKKRLSQILAESNPSNVITGTSEQ